MPNLVRKYPHSEQNLIIRRIHCDCEKKIINKVLKRENCNTIKHTFQKKAGVMRSDSIPN